MQSKHASLHFFNYVFNPISHDKWILNHVWNGMHTVHLNLLGTMQLEHEKTNKPGIQKFHRFLYKLVQEAMEPFRK